jgi:recombination protein RecR
MDHGAFGQLVKELARLPGFGPRSARRIALHLLTDASMPAKTLASTITHAANTMKICTICGMLDDHDPCHICADNRRDGSQLCIVSGVSDVWAVERTHQFKGRYHILGGILSAIDGVTPDMLRINSFIRRLTTEIGGHVTEIVLALPATIDGQTTSHYIQDCIARAVPAENRPKITRLALGLPVGGELDYLDDGTISAAFKARAVV